ncbi:hypothetical protein [Legionella brunensis]|uniref:Uncharacterized protein n=1 Tax=Legionella brunensis TaxID=29422 RepID=A0A0W0SPM6_9GAMM|nr:hypothetical protein [Legionella brunensis]KTC85217.1 hypothetical protein Lbru_1013 [Legionella brunensis]
MDWSIGKQVKLKNSLIILSILSLMGLSSSPSAFTNGQLILINSLGIVVNGSLGGTASNIKVQVNDSTGVCSTTASLAYGGVITVSWNSANTHSSTKCTDIVSVDVSALKTTSGVVQYDSTANPTPPAVATAPTTFLAPTTPIANIALIVTGNASPAMTNSTTSWGSSVGVPPIYLTSNGSISVTGIMGGVGMEGLKAESLMLRYGIMPVRLKSAME